MNAATSSAPSAFDVPAQSTVMPRAWKARRSDEVVLQVWRVIANAGAMGISPYDVRTRLNNIAPDTLKQHLHELRRKGHIRLVGVHQHGCWVATAKPPMDEQPPVWMIDSSEHAAEAGTATDGTPKDEAAALALAAARQLPNSVFALGQAAGFGVDIDAVHMPAEHKAAMGAAAAPMPEAEPAAAAPDRAGFHLFSLDDGPLFALRSDHRLLLRRPCGREWLLSPDETRALFRYLDSLMAIGHGSLSEATS